MTANSVNLEDFLRMMGEKLERTREQSINTAKLLFQLADNAVRMEVENALSQPIQEQNDEVEIIHEPEPCMEFG